MLDFLTPEVFDALIIVNLAVGLFLAGRRFRKDLKGPLPEDAPPSVRAAYPAAESTPKDV